MKLALRTLRLVQVAMLVSIGIYVVLGETIHPPPIAQPSFLYAASVASIAVVGAVMVVRRTLVLQSEGELRQKPYEPATLSRWRTGYIVTYALCEALALFGLILRLAGFSLDHVWPYYASGFVLMLLFWPKLPKTQNAKQGVSPESDVHSG